MLRSYTADIDCAQPSTSSATASSTGSSTAACAVAGSGAALGATLASAPFTSTASSSFTSIAVFGLLPRALFLLAPRAEAARAPWRGVTPLLPGVPGLPRRRLSAYARVVAGTTAATFPSSPADKESPQARLSPSEQQAC